MRIEEQCVIHVPQQEVWDVISDPKCYMRLVEGVTRWDVEGEQEKGLGARYAMLMKVGSAEVGGLIEVVEYDEPRDLAWTSVTGLDQRGRWRLRPLGNDATTVTLRLTYQAPGGLLATISDRVSSPLVRRNLKRSLQNLRAELEGTERASDQGPGIGSRLGEAAFSARVLAGTGLIRAHRPDALARALRAFARMGTTPATGYAVSSQLHPDEPAIIDERGTLTFSEVQERSNRLAHALSDHGILEGQGVGVMCRNHRGFVESVVALSKLGAHALLLNTQFAGPQLTDVVKREKPIAIVYDEEFGDLLSDAGKRRKRFIAWHDEEKPADPTLDQLIEEGDPADPVPPDEMGRTVILTSGTSGTPKGASRGNSVGIGPAVALLSRIPLRARENTMIAAPLFHSWGFAHFSLSQVLSSTIVLRRKFSPEGTLQAVAEHQATSCPMVPVMVQRIMDLPKEDRERYDVSSLRAVPLSGSALPGDLAIEFMDEFGDVIYNLYGSTEVAWASIATPADLRDAPGTAGKPPHGTVLKIYSEDGNELPQGEDGRIFVGNEMLFEGYTGGGSKDMIDGLMATGDVGHLDEAGRLFVSGRDDDMIVSGGENVFPREVEDLLSKHDKVADVAVIGVDDEKFGQRLKAFIVSKGKKPSEDDLKKYVKSNLAGYKVPREVEFIDELPRNATGKVLKRELAEKS